MATAQSLINAALRKLGALGVGETPDSVESGECLTVLNQMLEAWRTERLMAYRLVALQRSVTAGVSSVTIGTATPAADWVVTRPVRIESAVWLQDGTRYPLETEITAKEYAERQSASGTPEVLLYDPTMPNGTLRLAPTPNASGTLEISVRESFGSFTNLSTDITLPPGYERALSYNLAMELASDYQIAPTQIVSGIAADSKASVKRVNIVVPELQLQSGLPSRETAYDIRSN